MGDTMMDGGTDWLSVSFAYKSVDISLFSKITCTSRKWTLSRE